jgi:hypothetical protein
MATVTYATGEQHLYVDGALVDSAAYAGVLPSTSTGVLIGGSEFGSFHHPWIGDIDEVSIYSRPLAASEVAALHQCATQGGAVDGGQQGNGGAGTGGQPGTGGAPGSGGTGGQVDAGGGGSGPVTHTLNVSAWELPVASVSCSLPDGATGENDPVRLGCLSPGFGSDVVCSTTVPVGCTVTISFGQPVIGHPFYYSISGDPPPNVACDNSNVCVVSWN